MITGYAPQLARKRKRDLAVKWLLPYHEATAGGEAAMLRYLDDPDVPCFAEGWLKADKNRFHQERAPGAAKKYVFNPNSWVYAFRDSLTAVAVANEYRYPGNTVPNEGWGSKRGSTLLTPRHVVSCGHAPVGPASLDHPEYPTKIRFVGTDGETYDRTIVGEKYCYTHPSLGPAGIVTVNGAQHAWDCHIAVLDSDLPAAVIPARCISDSYKFNYRYARWDSLFISQSIEKDSPTPDQFGEQLNWHPLSRPFPASHYPRRHRSMCTHGSSKVRYYVWGGDSGMPLFFGYGTELLFAGFCGGGGIGPTGYPTMQSGVKITWEDLANQMIIDAELHAISRGQMAGHTGYTITVADDIADLLPP